MASRIIHLCLACELKKEYDFKDYDRFRFGTIIPDGVENKEMYDKSHFKIRLGDKEERTYDLTNFRKMFLKNMREDDLYLGYYIHLIEDLLYRHYMYDILKLNPKEEGYKEKIHSDYRQTNKFLIDKYNLKNDIKKIDGFSNEKINEVALFNLDKFLSEYNKDFEDIEYKERYYLKDDAILGYLNYALEHVRKELDALKNDSHFIDEYEWSWGK